MMDLMTFGMVQEEHVFYKLTAADPVKCHRATDTL
jgi:hypothetical protein